MVRLKKFSEFCISYFKSEIISRVCSKIYLQKEVAFFFFCAWKQSIIREMCVGCAWNDIIKNSREWESGEGALPLLENEWMSGPKVKTFNIPLYYIYLKFPNMYVWDENYWEIFKLSTTTKSYIYAPQYFNFINLPASFHFHLRPI